MEVVDLKNGLIRVKDANGGDSERILKMGDCEAVMQRRWVGAERAAHPTRTVQSICSSLNGVHNSPVAMGLLTL